MGKLLVYNQIRAYTHATSILVGLRIWTSIERDQRFRKLRRSQDHTASSTVPATGVKETGLFQRFLRFEAAFSFSNSMRCGVSLRGRIVLCGAVFTFSVPCGAVRLSLEQVLPTVGFIVHRRNPRFSMVCRSSRTLASKGSPGNIRRVCVCVRMRLENSEPTMLISQVTPDHHGRHRLADGYPYLHDASASKNVHVSNASIAVCVCISKSDEVSPLREPQQAPAQKLDWSRLFQKPHPT